jgi:hypothetical protein
MVNMAFFRELSLLCCKMEFYLWRLKISFNVLWQCKKVVKLHRRQCISTIGLEDNVRRGLCCWVVIAANYNCPQLWFPGEIEVESSEILKKKVQNGRDYLLVVRFICQWWASKRRVSCSTESTTFNKPYVCVSVYQTTGKCCCHFEIKKI